MLAFLKLVPLKDWLYAGVIALLLIVFGAYTKHERSVGAARILSADAAALVRATEKTAAETQRLKDLADKAEHAHDQEIADLRLYRATHPVHVGVCHAAGNNQPSVPSTAGSNSGNASPGSSSGDVLQVPAGDSLGISDIGPLLDILAGKADAVSAQLREYQSTR